MAPTPSSTDKGLRARVGREAELGAIIRDRRITLGLSQTELAAITGIDGGNLSRIERGAKAAHLDTYLRICAALGIALIAEARG